MNWYLKVLKEYANFEGRARRKEYWMFTLFQGIVIAILAIAISIISGDSDDLNSPLMITIAIYVLVTLIPTIAVTVRRLHDIVKKGSWYFIKFIPYIGSFWMLFLTCKDSVVGSNEWGENPKGIGNDDAISQIGIE